MPLIGSQGHMTKSHWIVLTVTWPGYMTQDLLYAVPPKPRLAI